MGRFTPRPSRSNTSKPGGLTPRRARPQRGPPCRPANAGALAPHAWKILVVVGFDRASLSALHQANRSARDMRCSLRLLHVRPPGEVGGNNLAETLRAWAEFEGGLSLEPDAVEVDRGDFVECVAHACEQGVMLVILGQRPEEGEPFEQLLPRLIALCPCPVSVQISPPAAAPP